MELVGKYLLIIGLGFIPLKGIYAQTGPGGINSSSSLSLWLKADDLSLSNGDAVATWSDATSNGNDAAQSSANKRPTYVATSNLNNMPAVSFDGGSNNSTSDNLEVPDDNSLDNTSGLVFYAVVRLNSIGTPNVQAIFGKRQSHSVSSNYAYTWFFYTSNRLFIDLNTSNNRNSTSASFSNNNNYLLSMHYNGHNATASQRVNKYVSGGLDGTSTESSTSILNSNQNLYIGTMNNNYGKYFSGLMGELLIFNDTLSSTQRILIDNYLSAKYNTALTSNDLYIQDDVANGDYDFDVAGIGQNSDGTNNTDAQGTGMVRIDNPSGLANGEWLLWGHDGGALDSYGVNDLPSGVESRLARTWRVSETGEVGTVDFSINLSDVPGSITASDLRLLIDTDNDGTFADETVGGGGVISGASNTGGSTFEWTGVDLDNNQRFTIGSINESQTPLPVDLVSFEAEYIKEKNQTEIYWKTASEFNNSHFEVEKSATGMQWNTLEIVAGNQRSNTQQFYRATDASPYLPYTYYRLKQIDLNGQFEYSDAVSIKVGTEVEEIKIYPNPVKNWLTISHVQNLSEIELLTQSGRNCSHLVGEIRKEPNAILIDLRMLPTGTYYIRMGDETYSFQKR
jgi:hypothetical protein